jgi:hypothetical protein
MASKIYPVEKLGAINLQELYLRANDWLDDIDFLDDELRFFKKILKLHFSLPANAIRIEFVEKQLFRLELNKQMIRAEVINHREVLELLIKNLISLEEDNVRDQHRDLEQKLTELNILFKKFKSDFFHLTEDLMGNKNSSGNK